MTVGKFLFAVTLFVCSVHAEVPFITKCLSTDTSCLRSSAQAAIPVLAAGIPELNVQPLDPLFIDQVESKSEQFNFTSTDTVIKGLSKCVVENIERNIQTGKIEIGVVCDIEYRGKYNVKGRLLVVPFEGKGDINAIVNQLYLNVDSVVAVKTDKHGQNHWVVKSYKYNYELRGRSEIELTNLFEGNEVLGRTARELLASSGNEIFIEVCPPILKSIVDKLVKTVHKFYQNVDSEDLAIDSF